MPDPGRPLPRSRSVVVCEVCNVVLGRDGQLVEQRPMTVCSHLRGAKYVAADAVVEALQSAKGLHVGDLDGQRSVAQWEPKDYAEFIQREFGSGELSSRGHDSGSFRSGEHALWDAHLVRLAALPRLAAFAAVEQEIRQAVRRMGISTSQAMVGMRRACEAMRRASFSLLDLRLELTPVEDRPATSWEVEREQFLRRLGRPR